MQIYSGRSEKIYEVRKMTAAERNKEFGEQKNYIITCDQLSGEEMRNRIEAAKLKYLKNECYVHQKAGCIPLIFSEVNKMTDWFLVHEQSKLEL